MISGWSVSFMWILCGLYNLYLSHLIPLMGSPTGWAKNPRSRSWACKLQWNTCSRTRHGQNAGNLLGNAPEMLENAVFLTIEELFFALWNWCKLIDSWRLDAKWGNPHDKTETSTKAVHGRSASNFWGCLITSAVIKWWVAPVKRKCWHHSCRIL